jgi:DNA-binding NarL/FixJ family response regulator
MHTRIRIIVGDTRGIIREGLRFLLEADGRVEVVAEASDASSLVTKVRSFSPNLLVIDERLLIDLTAIGIPAPTVVLCDALPRVPHDRRLVFVEKMQVFDRLLEVVRRHGRGLTFHGPVGQIPSARQIFGGPNSRRNV